MQETGGLKETRATALQLEAAKENSSNLKFRDSAQLSCEERVDRKLLTTVDDDCFYWDESQLLLKQGRVEESKEAKFMSAFYKNKELAYECINQEIHNKLDQKIIDLQRKIHPEKYLGISDKMEILVPRLPLNTGFVSAEHKPKVIPPMSTATRNEMINKLEQFIIEFKSQRDQCQGRSNFHWKEAIILEKCGQHLRYMKEREAWQACAKEVMLWNKKIRQTEDEVYQLIETGVKQEENEATNSTQKQKHY